MFLNIKEMEVRRIRFDETFEPGQIDFSDTGLRQVSGVHTEGSASVLENSGGEMRVQGKFSGTFEADCDRCLATALYPLDKSFDLFYRPPPDLEADEIKIDEGEAEIGLYEVLELELDDVMEETSQIALAMQRACRE